MTPGFVGVLPQAAGRVAVGLEEAGGQGEKGRFAGTGGTGDGERLARFDGELDFAEDDELAVGRGHALRQPAREDDGIRELGAVRRRHWVGIGSG